MTALALLASSQILLMVQSEPAPVVSADSLVRTCKSAAFSGDGGLLTSLEEACRLRGIVQCAPQGAEPIDVSTDSLCNRQAVVTTPGQRVTVIVEANHRVRGRWLSLDAGGPPGVLADRVLGPGANDIVVAPSAHRAISFVFDNGSPMTVSALQLLSLRRFELSGGPEGGELTIEDDPDAVTHPAAVDINGRRFVPRYAAASLVSIQGVAPGDAVVTPVYEGNVGGPSFRTTIRDAATSFWSLGPSDLSSVSVSVGGPWCDSASAKAVKIDLLGASDRVIGSAPAHNCHVTFGGLPFGRYELVVQASPVARRVLDVPPHSNATLRLEQITVSGHVRSGTVPMPGVTVQFADALNGVTADVIRVMTDENGAYSAVLFGPGHYDANLLDRGASVLGSDRDVDVRAGRSGLDWTLTGADVEASIADWDHRFPLDVTLRFREQSAFGMSGAIKVLGRDELPTAAFRGVGPGRYTLTVKERRDDAAGLSASADVDVQPLAGVVSVPLSLAKYAAELRIEDELRRPISDATLRTQDGVALPMIAPGVYDLAGSEPGGRLLLAGVGFTPMCLLAPKSGRETLVVDQGVERTVVVRGPQASQFPEPPGRLVWDGTACPIAFRQFEFVKAPEQDGQSARFVITNFPRAAEVRFLGTPFATSADAQALTVGADGIVRITLNGRR